MRVIEILILFGFLSILTTLSFAFETDQKSDTTIYTISDTLVTAPVFTYKDKPSGVESLYEFYRDSLKYPPTQDCMGRVYLKFVIEKDASLTNICIIRENCSEYNDEALRLVRLMSCFWKPAIKGKENVRYLMAVPVRFDLEKKWKIG
jgi:hypothetical protein